MNVQAISGRREAGEVVLPDAVYTERRRYHDELPEFLRIERVTDPEQVGLIHSVKDVMARLQHEAGFYVSEDVWQVVLRRAGEC